MKRVNYPTAGVVPRNVTEGARDETLGDEAQIDEAFDAMEFDPDELREFLAADLMEVPIDPAFKRRLRSKLWNMVRLRSGRSV